MESKVTTSVSVQHEGYPDDDTILEHVLEVARKQQSRGLNEDLIPPTKPQLAEMLRAAFAASLESEEGRPVTFTIFFARGSKIVDYRFDEATPLGANALVRLAPALDPERSAIAVMETSAGSLEIVGTRHSGDMNLGFLTIRVVSPGVLVVKYQADVVLTYRRRHFVLHAARFASQNETRELLELAPKAHSDPNRNAHSTACRIHVVSEMMRLGHGGTLLVVPDGAEWRSFVKSRFLAAAPVRRVLDAEKKNFDEWTQKQETVKFFDEQRGKKVAFDAATVVRSIHRASGFGQRRRQLEAELDSVARLTATDGMVVIAADLRILGFGVFFEMGQKPSTPVEISDPYEDAPRQTTDLTELGGARHQSGAAAAMAIPGALAVVVSADGSLTLMRVWDDGVLRAHKHRELAMPEWPLTL
ncbi:MAG: hypothetical protein QM756_12690 [Polyangiaceae bacterium]